MLVECQPLSAQIINIHMEDYYNTLLQHLNGYTVMGLFDGKRDIKDIVTLQTGTRGRVFFFDQEPMIRGVDDALWDYIFREPTIFANSELDSRDKEYVKSRYPNFIDWYYFANAMVSREWFSAQRYNYAGWTDHKPYLLDCNLVTGSRQYRLYVIYQMYRRHLFKNSFVSFDGSVNWLDDLQNNDQFGLLELDDYQKRIPNIKISYDNWGKNNPNYNGFMQSRIPIDYYNRINCVLVSETLCIENKLHLSEKVFKPIAAGKPFILIAGQKNLQYLQSYGFETFNKQWNEDYDFIKNPKKRIDRIFEIATELEFDKLFKFELGSQEHTQASKNIEQKLQLFNQAHVIAQRNREYFWSDEFYNLVFDEAVANLEVAKQQLAAVQVQRTAMMPAT